MSWVAEAGSYAAAALVRAAVTPSPSPSLREGLKQTDIAPGFLGFIVTFAVVAATVVLMMSMTRRVRRLNHTAGADHVVEADIRLLPEPMGAVPPTLHEVRMERKRAKAELKATQQQAPQPAPSDAPGSTGSADGSVETKD